MKQVLSNRWVRQLSGVEGKPIKLSSDENYIHPCVIGHQNTLIHAPDLAETNPEFYQQLTGYANSEGYVLLADRRQQDSQVASDRRSSWLPRCRRGRRPR